MSLDFAVLLGVGGEPTTLLPSLPLLVLLGLAVGLAAFFILLNVADSQRPPMPEFLPGAPWVEEVARKRPLIRQIDLPRVPNVLLIRGLPADAVLEVLVDASGSARKMNVVWCSHAAVKGPVRRAVRTARFESVPGPEGRPTDFWVRLFFGLGEGVCEATLLGPA
jgi:hypothetical protein